MLAEVRDLAGLTGADTQPDASSSLYWTIIAKIEAEEAAMEASEEFKKDACNRLTTQIRDEIEKDLHRTKTSARIETKEGQDEMRNVLLAVAYCLPEIGYCQGMNFIASCLIAITDSEEQGFIIFMYLLLKKDMKTLFIPVSIRCDVTSFMLYRESQSCT